MIDAGIIYTIEPPRTTPPLGHYTLPNSSDISILYALPIRPASADSSLLICIEYDIEYSENIPCVLQAVVASQLLCCSPTI